MTTLNDPLRSVICGQSWHWDSRGENLIMFNVDGTGQLICRGELNVWIASEIDWKPLKVDLLDQDVNVRGRNSTEIAQLEMELTLTTRRIPNLGHADMSKYTINESLLTKEAFHPKIYKVCLERGIFKTAFDMMQAKEIPYTPRFGLRLTFDKSPYPKRQEWKNPGGTPDAMKFWEWKEFCGQEL